MKTILFLCFVSIPVIAGSKDYKHFANTFSKCLAKNDIKCLEGLVPKKMYFPEQKSFGCKTADTKKGWHATPQEFVGCIYSSSVKNSSTSKEVTLMEVLTDCFGPKAKLRAKFGYYQTNYGYLCHIEKKGGKVVLTSVGAGG